MPSNYVKKEKPSIFDSIKKKVTRRSESKSNLASPLDSPIAAKAVDIDISGSDVATTTNGNSAIASSSNQTVINTFALVKYNYEAQQSDELSLVKGTRIRVLEKSSDGWWRGELGGLFGWFPSNYVQEEPMSPLPEPRTTSRSVNTKPLTVANGYNANGNGYHHQEPSRKESPQSVRRAVLDVVVALYSFTSQNEEELSFQKGERLEILDRPANDPDW